MTEDKREDRGSETTPSEAVGESGDEAARREADEAVVTDGEGAEEDRSDVSEQSSAERE
ncbi:MULTISPECIES: hypothetical protein [Streptomyces]|uniref:Uncharacterized protein n=1 Tax=Streptomyces lateritius TaxID=67313 RepID=A0ABW6YJ16_9ACTN|nr:MULTISPECIES: hypothetical protein [Streptomyces]QGZ52358.1 hypothetical protein GPZ77_32095 [Streptomyces sp. QHH-9511]GGT85805.1 hypothetical protein GCM10010272_33250 [Streptomyces lateritius]